MFAIAKLLVLTAGGGGAMWGGSSGPHRRPESVLGSNNGFRRVGNGAVSLACSLTDLSIIWPLSSVREVLTIVYLWQHEV